MEFNPFDYRPFLVRERVAVEEFTQESPVWERAWEMYREKVPSVPERTKLDVLNDLRYLLVRAHRNHAATQQWEADTAQCRAVLDTDALAWVAGKLLVLIQNELSSFKPDLSPRGEVPEKIPLLWGKFSGLPSEWWKGVMNSQFTPEEEELVGKGIYSREELDRLRLLAIENFTAACLRLRPASPPAEQLRRLGLFDVCNCKVKDEKLADFHRKLADEMELRKDKKETVRLLPLAAAQKAGCLVNITQNTAKEAFPQYDFSKKISDYNTGNIADKHGNDLNALTEEFRAFLD